MKLIVLLIAIAFSDGKKLDRIYLPPNYQSSGGSDDVLQTPKVGTIVVDDNVLHRKIAENIVTDSDVNERLVDNTIDASQQSPSDRIKNERNNLFQNTRENELTSSEHQFRIPKQRQEHARAALERNAAILRFENKNDGDGTYAYTYETENGIFGEENRDGAVARGGYSYVGDDGVIYTVRYLADENGFQAQGDHFPTAPPVPEEILRALEQNARDEAAGIYDDGSYDERKYGGDGDRGSRIIFLVMNKLNVTTDSAVAVDATPPTQLGTSRYRNEGSIRREKDLGASTDANNTYLPPVLEDGSTQSNRNYGLRNGYRYSRDQDRHVRTHHRLTATNTIIQGAAAPSDKVKNLIVLLIVGVAVAELLDKGYLPPRSASSGGSPGAINIPFELPNYSFNEKGFTKRPEIVKGINRVPSKVTDHKKSASKATINDNSFTLPTTSGSQDFTQSPPLAVSSGHSGTIGHHYDLNNPSDFDESLYANDGGVSNSFPAFPISTKKSLQQVQNGDKYPSVSVIDNHTQANLVYSEDTDTINVGPSKVSSLVNDDVLNIDNYLSSPVHTDMLTFPVTNQQLGSVPNNTPTSNYPNDGKGNLPTVTDDSFMSSEVSSIPPITIYNESLIMNRIDTDSRPERIQAQLDRAAMIVSYEQARTPEGYSYSYDTSNGIHGDESGIATNGVRAKGSYSYIGDDGKLYYVEYTADENGFLPKGSHFPTSPPIPDAILKVIEQAVKNENAGIFDDGSYNEDKYGHEKYQGELRHRQKFKVINRDYQSKENFNGHIDKNDILKQYGDRVMPKGFDNLEEGHNISLEPSSHHVNNILLPALQSGLLQNVNSKNDINHQSGYHYFPAQSMLHDMQANFFSSRLSEIKSNSINKTIQLEKMNRKVPEPFLTAYVSRKDDDLESEESDKMTFENQYPRNNKDSSNKYSDYSHDENEPNDNLLKSGTILEQQLQFENRLLNTDVLIPSQEKGDKNNILTLEQGDGYQPPITTEANIQFTTSGTVSNEFPSSFTTSKTTDAKAYTSGNIHFSFQNFPSSTPFDQSIRVPSSMEAKITNPEGHESYSNPPFVNGHSNLISTSTLTSDLVSGDIRFGKTHGPSHRAKLYPDVHEGQTTTENFIGEDFSGPKQLQRFDPITGYHY